MPPFLSPLPITIFLLVHLLELKDLVTGSTALVWHAGRERARMGAASSLYAFLLPDQRAHLVCSGEKGDGWEKRQKPSGSGCCRMRLSRGGRAYDQCEKITILQYFGIQHLELACAFPGLLQSLLHWTLAFLQVEQSWHLGTPQCAKGVTEDLPHGSACISAPFPSSV